MNVQPQTLLARTNANVAVNHALVLGSYYFAADYLVACLLGVAPVIRAFLGIENPAFFYGLAMLAGLLKILGLQRFGQSPLVADTREICVYDFVTVLLGLILFLTGIPTMPAKMLNYGFSGIMLIRLCWHFKTVDGAAMATWPVFGLLGLFGRRPIGRDQVPAWHDYFVYGSLLLTPLFGFVFVQLSAKQLGVMYISIALVFLLLRAPFLMARSTSDEPAPKPRAKTAAAPQVPHDQPATEPDLALDSTERALVLAFRGLEAQNKPAILKAVIALAKAFDTVKADQSAAG